jgi:undecaprenyl-diphosphatase
MGSLRIPWIGCSTTENPSKSQMKMFQALALGAIQGLTEFLPISSTAHLNLVQGLLGWQSPGMVLDTSLHLGTLAATGAWLLESEWHEPMLSLPLLAKVALATLPAGLAGLLLEGWIDRHLRGPRITSAMLIMGAGLLWLAEEQVYRRGGQALELSQLGWRQASLIGFAQMLALIPGFSRSGATMTAGLMSGLKRADAVRFSYLLSVPVVAASGLFKLKDLLGQRQGEQRLGGQDQEEQWQGKQKLGGSSLKGALLAGGISAAVVGFVTLEAVLKQVQQHSLKPFALYRLGLGVSVWLSSKENV